MNAVHIIFGPLGAGKSTLARQITAQLNAVSFSIDEWMQRLYGPDLPQPLSLEWVLPRVRRCEAQIWETCVQVLASGKDVVLDQGFMTKADRTQIRLQAHNAGYEVLIHFVNADKPLRRERLLQRNLEKGAGYSFEITAQMFEAMDARFEHPSPSELKECCNV
ncbi:putative kinase [Pseudomonas sp. GM50]|uniref:AAA family ATPase n=1 Tax=Pseudomonas sp. GM50 TaxID=1144332 RepID=UPI0002706882|nr:ATP-binding protein [Pseudomonas sp. GM50]EJM67596.1 putative kinase [Pseudomonas sp. GM50]